MTWSDPIVDEVRRARDAYAARFHYDLRAIFDDLKEQEKRKWSQAGFLCRAEQIAAADRAGHFDC